MSVPRHPAAAPPSGRRRALRFAALVALIATCIGPAAADPVAVTATPVPLDTGDPGRTVLGPLQYRGGVELRSPDPLFGGYSALEVEADGSRLTAVADFGQWLRARIVTDKDGWLVGVADARIEPLLDAAGRPFPSKRAADAESLTRLADGSLLVGFENRHRLLRYARVGAAGEPFPAPPGLDRAPGNTGLEALTRLADNRLLAITEDYRTADGKAVRGWVGPSPWQPLALVTTDGFLPTSLALLPGGDVIVVERRVPFLAVRLRRIAAADIRPDARLEPVEIARFQGSLTFDNFEGVSARRTADGETLLYLISDDNRFVLQRTLLMAFALTEE